MVCSCYLHLGLFIISAVGVGYSLFCWTFLLIGLKRSKNFINRYFRRAIRWLL